MDDPLNEVNRYRFGEYTHQEGATTLFDKHKAVTYSKPVENVVEHPRIVKNMEAQDVLRPAAYILGGATFAYLLYLALFTSHACCFYYE